MNTISCHAHLSVELNLWGRYINLRFDAMFFSSVPPLPDYFSTVSNWYINNENSIVDIALFYIIDL